MSEEITEKYDFISDIKGMVGNWPDRPSWDEYFMAMALLVSSRSACSRLNVGCVLVSGEDKRFLSAGYNGFLPGAPHISRVRDNHELATVHAEQNAVTYAAKKGINICNSIAYVTHFPCIHCTKVLLSAGVSKIFYNQDYRNDSIVHELLVENKVPAIQL